MTIIKKWKSINFVYKMLGALFLGFIFGLIFKEKITCIAWIGTLFVKLLQMAALPLIFFSLIAGIASLDDPQLLGKVGLKIMLYYILTTAFAACVGVVITTLVSPGTSLILSADAVTAETGEMTSIGDTLLGMIPTNIFSALSSGTLVAAIIFGSFFGIAIVLMKDKEAQARLQTGIKDIADALLRLVEIVLGLAPFGVFALIANTVGTNGAQVVGFLAKYALTIYLGIAIMLIIYIILVTILTKIKPGRFVSKAMPAFITAFSTCSSLASMPMNLECANNMKLPRNISSFTIPLGAQINKDGTAILITSAVLAASQASGVSMTLGNLIQLVVTVLIITTGIAGVPGGTIVLLTLFTTMFNLPSEVAAIIMGAFAIIEMPITGSNIIGDLAGTAIVCYPECKDDEEFKTLMCR